MLRGMFSLLPLLVNCRSFMTINPQSSDPQLIHAIKKNDEMAFNLLFDRYWEMLWLIAEKKTGYLGHAQDIVQELFIETWNRRHKLHIKGEVRTYLIAALYLKIFHHFRKEGFRQEHLQRFEAFVQASQSHADTIEAALQEEEKQIEKLHEVILAAIAQMPPQMRKVFDLKLQQQSNEQIAGTLHISVNTVKNHLREGRNRLRKAGGSYEITIILLAILLD